MACQLLFSYLNLPFAHDLVNNLVVVLVEHALVITLLVAQDPQVLGALQLDLKLLSDDTGKENKMSESAYAKIDQSTRRCLGN